MLTWKFTEHGTRNGTGCQPLHHERHHSSLVIYLFQNQQPMLTANLYRKKSIKRNCSESNCFNCLHSVDCGTAPPLSQPSAQPSIWCHSMDNYWVRLCTRQCIGILIPVASPKHGARFTLETEMNTYNRSSEQQRPQDITLRRALQSNLGWTCVWEHGIAGTVHYVSI